MRLCPLVLSLLTVRRVSELEDRLSWSDWMSGRLDCLLLFPPDVFLTGAEQGDGELREPAELQRGISGVVEQEEKEEVLCFLERENIE